MKATERIRAREMRKEGNSVKEIERKLGVSRGSVSRWVRDIILTAEQKLALEERISEWGKKCLGSDANKRNAEERRKKRRKVGMIRAKADVYFRTICSLYWGEGTKGRDGTVSVSNSDADVLRFWGRWLVKEGYGNSIRFIVYYYGENGLTEEEIREWWAVKLDFIPISRLGKFRKCVINRASQKKKIGKLPYGTATLQVYKVDLWEEIMGGIDFLRNFQE
jgi:transcriptional regulator with XRE-family HTH domain